MVSEKNNPLKLTLMIGERMINEFSLIIISKKLAQIIIAIAYARENQKKLKLL